MTPEVKTALAVVGLAFTVLFLEELWWMLSAARSGGGQDDDDDVV